MDVDTVTSTTLSKWGYLMLTCSYLWDNMTMQLKSNLSLLSQEVVDQSFVRSPTQLRSAGGVSGLPSTCCQHLITQRPLVDRLQHCLHSFLCPVSLLFYFLIYIYPSLYIHTHILANIGQFITQPYFIIFLHTNDDWQNDKIDKMNFVLYSKC